MVCGLLLVPLSCSVLAEGLRESSSITVLSQFVEPNITPEQIP